ncbi:MAG: hypothetical protein H6Q66_797 [Firmicutes bacterium]|nr:hypothetical protein [Bacillota bacterium]
MLMNKILAAIDQFIGVMPILTTKNSLVRAARVFFIFVFVWIGINCLPISASEPQRQTNHYIIDRFEGGLAVLEREDCSTFNIPREQLPAEAKEGDVITDKWEIDRSTTELIKKQITELFKTIKI